MTVINKFSWVKASIWKTYAINLIVVRKNVSFHTNNIAFYFNYQAIKSIDALYPFYVTVNPRINRVN